MTPTIAFLGTGLMGAPMARNLLAAGFDVTVWNRSPEKAQALVQHGATVASSPRDAVKDAEIVIVILSDGAAVHSLLSDQGVAAAMASGALLIDMSSTKPEEARAEASLLANHGLRHLDAPVSGGTRGAAAATLAIMVGGDETVFTDALPVLSVLGRPVRVGPTGSGQLAKLANQAIVGVTIATIAEAMLLVDRGGADPAAIRDALMGGFADSVILQQHGARMTTQDFTPGATAATQLKDLNNAMDEAAALGLSLPLTEQIQGRYRRLVHDLEGADLDHSGIYRELLDLNKSA